MLHSDTIRKIERATKAWTEKREAVAARIGSGTAIGSLAGELEELARLEAEYVLWHQVGEHISRLIEREGKGPDRAADEALKQAIERATKTLRRGPDRTTSLIKRALSDEETDGTCKFLNHVEYLLD